MFQTLPIVGEDFGEQTGHDAEVADGEDVQVDQVAQTMNNYSQKRNRSELTQMKCEDIKVFHHYSLLSFP